MDNFRVCVMTGTSSGIGYECAGIFRDNGYRVYGLSRSGSGPDGVVNIRCDVTDEMSLAGIFDKIYVTEGRIDVVIANAGSGISGAVEFTEAAEAKKQFDVNFFGVFNTLKCAAPYLKRSHGRFAAVSSAAAVFPIPFQAFYSSSKAAVNSLVRAAANELRPFGVSAGYIMPGDVKTSFTDKRRKSGTGDDVYGGMISGSVAVMEHDERNGMPAHKVASVIYRTVTKRKMPKKTTVGVRYKLLDLLSRLLPVGLQDRIIGKLYIKKLR